jgi:lauroyl/myristoyl acyltransferase
LHAFVRAALKGIPASMPLPACLGAAKSVRTIREWRMKGYLNDILEYLPERLAETKWINRCRIEGLDHVLRARQNGCPVVLAFSHFGAYRMSRFWLRAAGVPVATLIIGKAE